MIGLLPGGTSPWSVSSFTTFLEPPTTPVLQRPYLLEKDVSLSPVFSLTTSSNIDSVQIQVARDSGFQTLIFNDSAYSESSGSMVGHLDKATTYYWRARTRNSLGQSSWTAPSPFTTIPFPPGIPHLVSPLDSAMNILTSSKLIWNNTIGGEHFRIQVSTNSNFSIIAYEDTVSGDTSGSIAPLSTSTHYYWRVETFNAGGNSGWS
jgi:hypothetical protein